MRRVRRSLVQVAVAACALLCACGAEGDDDAIDSGTPWTTEQANAWYAAQPWLVGANFVPSTASNQLEMWQADTFDPDTIDRELGWAADVGFDTVRVFLHHMLWEQDADGFLDRIDQLLDIADGHGIRVMLVLFDGVWDPYPQLGAQPEPEPYVHNSRWVQSPGADILGDLDRHAELEGYVVGVVSRFRDDPRVVAWDVFNEADNQNAASYRAVELLPSVKEPAALALMQRACGWARSVEPTQPLTSGVFIGGWGDPGDLSPINDFMLHQADIVSFHGYFPPASMEGLIEDLQQYGRPIVCTEYMARSVDSTFQGVLPVFAEADVGAIHWGWVDGRSQTKYPWSSWTNPVAGEPDPWFHDVLHPDGTPYDQAEIDFLRGQLGN